jgi:hypothetical protein
MTGEIYGAACCGKCNRLVSASKRRIVKVKGVICLRIACKILYISITKINSICALSIECKKVATSPNAIARVDSVQSNYFLF